MRRALTAKRAELHLFKTLRHGLLITGRRVVPALAFSARQNSEITHCFTSFFFSSFSLLVEIRAHPLSRTDHFGRDDGQASHRRLAVIT